MRLLVAEAIITLINYSGCCGMLSIQINKDDVANTLHAQIWREIALLEWNWMLKQLAQPSSSLILDPPTISPGTDICGCRTLSMSFFLSWKEVRNATNQLGILEGRGRGWWTKSTNKLHPVSRHSGKMYCMYGAGQRGRGNTVLTLGKLA